jgi:Spy/CpxP family protein refolding chaperone
LEEIMKLVRSVAFLVAIGAGAMTSVACGGSVEQPPQTTAGAQTKAPVGASTHGVVKVVGDALGEVSLRDSQRTEIEKLALDAEVRHAPIMEHRKAMMVAVADQIEKGAIDRAALQSNLDQVAADVEKIGADDRGALVKLHGLLDAEQRNAFVDALEKQMKAKRGNHEGHGPPGLMRLKQLADELNLTDQQRSAIRDALRESFKEGMRSGPDGAGEAGQRGRPDWHAMMAAGPFGGKKMLEAFRGDKLDADKLVPPPGAKAMLAFGADRAIGVASKILPILTPEQRKIAADKLRAAAASGDQAFFGR